MPDQHPKDEENGFPKPNEVFLVIVFGVIFVLIPQVMIYLLFAEGDPPEISKSVTQLLLFVGELSLLIVPIAYLRRKNIDLRDAFRLNPVSGRIMGICAVISLGMVAVIDELDRLIRLVVPLPEIFEENIAEMLMINSVFDFVMIVSSAVILAAIIEEVIFRGFLQQSIERHIDVTKAVIYASIAWTAVHGNLYVAIQLFLFGFFLGWVAWRTNSVFPAILAHGINNSIAIAYANFAGETPIPLYEWGEHVSPIVLLISIGVIYQGIIIIDAAYRKSTPSSS